METGYGLSAAFRLLLFFERCLLYGRIEIRSARRACQANFFSARAANTAAQSAFSGIFFGHLCRCRLHVIRAGLIAWTLYAHSIRLSWIQLQSTSLKIYRSQIFVRLFKLVVGRLRRLRKHLLQAVSYLLIKILYGLLLRRRFLRNRLRLHGCILEVRFCHFSSVIKSPGCCKCIDDKARKSSGAQTLSCLNVDIICNSYTGIKWKRKEPKGSLRSTEV